MPVVVANACALCGEDRPLNNNGICANSDDPRDPRPRFNACADLVRHLGSNLTRLGRARLRTSQRSEASARRLLTYSAHSAGFEIEVEVGPSWVAAFPTGNVEKAEKYVPPKRHMVEGLVLEDLDIPKLHLQLVEERRKASLYREMASLEEGWEEAAVESQRSVVKIEKLIAAWEEQHGY